MPPPGKPSRPRDRMFGPRLNLLLPVLAGLTVVGGIAALLNPQALLAVAAATVVVAALIALLIARIAAGDTGLAPSRDSVPTEADQHAVVLRERLRMARDLHDTLAHSMAATLSQIRLVRKLAAVAPERLADELERAEEVALEGLREARAAVTRTRYQAVRDDGLGAALGRLTKRLRQRKGVDIELNVDARAFVLADARAETVFRVVEEAVHNIERHAGVERGSIVATVKPGAGSGCLEVIVRDDGKGFDPSVGVLGHYGITGMREQVESIGGSLLIESAPHQGTQLTISVRL
jgi:signal transduction histidine kinase